MAELATTRPGYPRTLERMLRCPICGSRLAFGEILRCSAGHEFQVQLGIPRLVVDVPAEHERLAEATSVAFGEQWNRLGDDARVGMDDLRLHLPTGWDTSTFGGVILDAGCGMGRYTTLVGDLGADVVGLDRSAAVEKAASKWTNALFVQGDLLKPPFAPESFDVVYSFGVLHHLPAPLAGFRACLSLVRPGGVLLVWVYSSHGGLLRSGRRAARWLVAQIPALRRPLASAAAVALWIGYVLPHRLLKKDGKRLAFYRDKDLRQLRVDCHDALAAPSEYYLSADDCRAWLRALGALESGFERRRDGSGWVIWARKPGAEAP